MIPSPTDEDTRRAEAFVAEMFVAEHSLNDGLMRCREAGDLAVLLAAAREAGAKEERARCDTALQAAAAYILTLRQMIFANDAEVIVAAGKRSDDEGSAWTAAAMKLGFYQPATKQESDRDA